MVTTCNITLKQFIDYLQNLQKEAGPPNFSKPAAICITHCYDAISARDPKARKLALEYVVDRINETN